MSAQLDLFASAPPTPDPKARVAPRPFLQEMRVAIKNAGGFHCDRCPKFVEMAAWDDVKLCVSCRGAA